MPDTDMFSSLQQERHYDEQMHVVQVRQDTLWFCNAVQELVVQIQAWLCGCDIHMVATIILHSDESIRLWPNSLPACYDVSTLLLKRQAVEARLLPLAVYGEPGSRGRALLVVADPHGIPVNQMYILSLSRQTSCWTLRPSDRHQTDAVSLSKATFLSAISTLCSRKSPSG